MSFFGFIVPGQADAESAFVAWKGYWVISKYAFIYLHTRKIYTLAQVFLSQALTPFLSLKHSAYFIIIATGYKTFYINNARHTFT